MAYSQELADRVGKILDKETAVEKKEMFGGVAFLLRGNMACGVIADDLMVRVGPEIHAEALAEPGARLFDFTGRPMKGWVVVAGEAVAEEGALRAWVQRGVAFAGTLPAK